MKLRYREIKREGSLIVTSNAKDVDGFFSALDGNSLCFKCGENGNLAVLAVACKHDLLSRKISS